MKAIDGEARIVSDASEPVQAIVAASRTWTSCLTLGRMRRAVQAGEGLPTAPSSAIFAIRE